MSDNFWVELGPGLWELAEPLRADFVGSASKLAGEFGFPVPESEVYLVPDDDPMPGWAVCLGTASCVGIVEEPGPAPIARLIARTVESVCRANLHQLLRSQHVSALVLDLSRSRPEVVRLVFPNLLNLAELHSILVSLLRAGGSLVDFAGILVTLDRLSLRHQSSALLEAALLKELGRA